MEEIKKLGIRKVCMHGIFESKCETCFHVDRISELEKLIAEKDIEIIELKKIVCSSGEAVTSAIQREKSLEKSLGLAVEALEKIGEIADRNGHVYSIEVLVAKTIPEIKKVLS